MVCRRGRGINRLLIYCLFNCLFLTARLSLSCLLSFSIEIVFLSIIFLFFQSLSFFLQSFSKSRQYLSVYSLSVCLSFCVFTRPLVRMSICLSVSVTISLSVSVYVFLCLCPCLSLHTLIPYFFMCPFIPRLNPSFLLTPLQLLESDSNAIEASL